MSISAKDLKLNIGKVFAESHDYQTPFYNRTASGKKLIDKFKKVEKGAGLVYMISEPLGTGKTFFIDYVSKELLGKQDRQRPLYAKGLTLGKADKYKGDILFIDEMDIKSTWEELSNAAEVISRHVEKTGRNTIVIGDYCLRNPDLCDQFSNKKYLTQFEPLNREFLAGILDQRVKAFMRKNNGSAIISDDLYNILTPDWGVSGTTLRTILSLLAQLAEKLPFNSKKAYLDLELALDWIQDMELFLTSQRQEDYLNRFLDFLEEEHPGGSGLDGGILLDQLYFMGKDMGFSSPDEFLDEIIDPFCRSSLLVSSGIPHQSKEGRFITYPKPYLPTIQTILLSQL